MNNLKRIWDHPWTFWLLLSLPALPMIYSLIMSENMRRVLHPSGEFSVRFLVIAMALTPLIMLFPKVRALRWLMKRRRYIGLAAFGYAAIHTLAYLLHEANMSAVVADLAKTGIWTGWLAFLIFVPMALTSNDASVQRMGSGWKSLQRLVYPAALLTAAHWYFLEYEIGGALVHFLPLLALEAYRVWKVNAVRSARAAG
jgi:methionine sulfoxide reductase heme-binding subunit